MESRKYIRNNFSRKSLGSRFTTGHDIVESIIRSAENANFTVFFSKKHEIVHVYVLSRYENGDWKVFCFTHWDKQCNPHYPGTSYPDIGFERALDNDIETDWSFWTGYTITISKDVKPLPIYGCPNFSARIHLPTKRDGCRDGCLIIDGSCIKMTDNTIHPLFMYL